MTDKEITKTFRKKESDKSSNLNFYVHCVIILGLSFGFTIFMVEFHGNRQNLYPIDEIEKIIENYLINHEHHHHVKSERKINNDRKFGYLDEHQENDVKKRSKKSVSENLVQEPPIAEFFHPTLKSELEKNDTQIMKQTGWKGAAPGGDSWVWMTAYSRIPFEAIEGFCRKTREYCPPGPTGSPGLPGQKGIKGEIGLQGPPGMKGDTGLSTKGARGAKGVRGDSGRAGVDGLDGTPGEPGLDGVPGRNGVDGSNGRDGDKGEKGENGIFGMKGEKGIDGKDGYHGSKGEKGEKGVKGLAGPQGSRGTRGSDGQNGVPGTCIYTRGSGGSGIEGNDFYLPPQIPVSSIQQKNDTPVVVNEGDHLRLRCAATGNPTPTIVWTREDGKIIDGGSIKDHSAVGATYNFTKINRVHMGTYVCIADNGITPSAKYKIPVEVHFKPMVKIAHQREQNVSIGNSGSTTFNCISEAFPEPVMYWERLDSDTNFTILKHDNSKYIIGTHTVENKTYEFNSSLTIKNIDSGDHTDYYCVSKNYMGTQRIKFSLMKPGMRYWYGRDGDMPLISGETPAVEGYEDVCKWEKCEKCEVPKNLQCKDASLSLTDLTGGKNLEVRIMGGLNYSDMGNRTQDCELSIVGKPVLNYYEASIPHGAWLKDPITRENVTVEKIWITNENEPYNLYEYKNRYEYQKSQILRTIKLNCPVKGNAHIIYNGFFYYYCDEQTKLIKYDLRTDQNPREVSRAMENLNKTHLLYSSKHNLIDFCADDNGIWIIHAALESNNTIVTKINETNLQEQITFDVSIQHDKIGEMFIICGVLYAVDSTVASQTKIRFALDLYSGKLLEKELDFTNPLNGTKTIGFNHNTKELYTWNGGHQLSYPVRINAMGTNVTVDESIKPYLAKTVVRSRVKVIEKKQVDEEQSQTKE